MNKNPKNYMFMPIFWMTSVFLIVLACSITRTLNEEYTFGWFFAALSLISIIQYAKPENFGTPYLKTNFGAVTLHACLAFIQVDLYYHTASGTVANNIAYAGIIFFSFSFLVSLFTRTVFHLKTFKTGPEAYAQEAYEKYSQADKQILTQLVLRDISGKTGRSKNHQRYAVKLQSLHEGSIGR